MIKFLLYLAERGYIPDILIKKAALFISRRRLMAPQTSDAKEKFINSISNGDIAEKTRDANDQHYEVPPEFFKNVLGKRLKYSCSLFQDGNNLDDAEVKMLDLYIKRAEIKNGQKILDLGCGWGSFSIYAAEKFPDSKITSISNSFDQIEFINTEAKKKKLKNLNAIKMDVNNLNLVEKFDRIISIEMFEHMRNYGALLKKLSSHLLKDGKMLVHIFTHRDHPYPYEVRGPSDWMSKYFFTSGLMPSHDIFSYFDEDFLVEQSWKINGLHYAKTCNLWLQNHYKNKKAILDIFTEHYPSPRQWFVRWQLFFLACEELFAYHEGKEWFVSHYLLAPKQGEV